MAQLLSKQARKYGFLSAATMPMVTNDNLLLICVRAR